MSLFMELNLELPDHADHPGACYMCLAPAISASGGHLPLCHGCADYLESVARLTAERHRRSRLKENCTMRTFVAQRPRRAEMRGKKPAVVVLHGHGEEDGA